MSTRHLKIKWQSSLNVQFVLIGLRTNGRINFIVQNTKDWSITMAKYRILHSIMFNLYIVVQFIKVCQWLAAGRWFSPVSSTNKTDHRDITGILLKVALNAIHLHNAYMIIYTVLSSIQRETRPIRTKKDEWLDISYPIRFIKPTNIYLYSRSSSISGNYWPPCITQSN